MKYYELVGKKGNDMIIERFFEDGRRFIKYVPFNPKILVAVKQQFKDKPVEVDYRGGWIVIIKTGIDPAMENAAKRVLKGEELTIERLAEAEKEMLQMAGYKVSYIINETEKSS